MIRRLRSAISPTVLGARGHSLVVALSLLVVATGCRSPHEAENRAAKERFLRGETGASASGVGSDSGGVAKTALDPAKVLSDPEEMEKAILLDASAVAERLRSFRFDGRSDTIVARGRRKLRLKETFEWRESGNGNFSTRLANSRDHGLETWWVDRKLYLRRRHGPVRLRPVEGREHLKYRDDIVGAFGAAYKLFRGRLKLTSAGAASVGGRQGARFDVSLADAPQTRIAERLPAHPEKVDLGDLKITTAQRRVWRSRATPRSATGSVTFDSETGVVLSVDFKGFLTLEDKENKSELAVQVVARMHDVGRPVDVRAPSGAVPEPIQRRIESRRFDLVDMVRIEDFLIDRWEFPNEKGASPRTAVSYRQARDACRSVGKRLCTLKEWQKACHSDRPRNLYPYGRIYNAERCNSDGDGPKALGERRECRGEFEVYDLVGNVGEWVETKGKNDRKEWCVAGGSFADKEKARCKRCVPREDVGRVDARIGFRCCR